MGIPETIAGGPVGPAYEDAADVRRPLHPDSDPFYAAPQGFEYAEPGTVLRVRSVTTALFGLIPQRFPAWQLLYRSTDMDGEPAAAVTTVLLPAGAARDGRAVPRPLLSFQSAIDAVSATCFPSYALRRGARAAGTIAQGEFLFIAAALSRGWAVSVPDHEGTAGRWGIPREPGYLTLDGLRAAISFPELGLDPSPRIGLWGYSGGGLATAWAVETAPGYAPELAVAGAVLGSPVGDLPSAFLRLNGTVHAGLPTLVVAGLRRAYPALRRVIAQYVDGNGRRLLEAAEGQTTAAAVVRLAFHNLDDNLTVPLADLLALPDIVAIFDELQVGVSRPSAPLLVLQAVHDQIIAVDDIDGLVARYRGSGAHVTYLRDLLSEHLSLLPLSAPSSLDYLGDRFAGRALPASETRTVRSVAGTVRAVRGMAGIVLNTVRMLLGRPIGA